MTVALDGRMSSLINFKQVRFDALTLIAKGEKILWEIDLGFFDGLSYPFGSEVEAKSQIVAIEHFVKDIWPEFLPYTKGLSLYRGPVNLEAFLKKDPVSAQFEFSDYLQYLTINIPDSLPLYLYFEENDDKKVLTHRLLSKEYFQRYEIFLNNEPYPQKQSHALLLPPISYEGSYSDLETMASKLKNPYHFISEPFLISEWDGLDFLFVSSEMIDHSALRKLKGFAAAGGTVVTCGRPLEIDNAISFEDYFS